jgi:hypothetical protein
VIYYVREIVGWLFIVLGLVIFWIVFYSMLPAHQFFESGPMTLIGIFLFRGGIHFLKVAVAARICQQTEARRPRPLGARAR